MISQFRISGRLREVTRLFIVRVRWSLLTYLGGALGLLAFGHLGLALIHARTDLVASPILIVLLLVYFLELQHTCYASLVVSENVNPFLAQALISGVATVSLSLILTPRLGLWGIVLSFGAVQLCCNNWWPVWRGIRGLKLGFAEYWRLFFSLTTDGF
jgi:O-antigen/teichoic acid export membrane protein